VAGWKRLRLDAERRAPLCSIRAAFQSVRWKDSKSASLFRDVSARDHLRLAGEVVGKRDKVSRRRKPLEAAGIATQALTNVDLRDAALCALTAHALLRGCVRNYGCERDGLIVVPLGVSATSSGRRAATARVKHLR
jgi:hypothetical protein